MLQADIVDKNRYIATLEKRLLQARRTSHSRVSMHFASRMSQQSQQDGRISQLEEGNVHSMLQEKDKEIDELRAKLDDQTRMVNALRSAQRKRDVLDNRKSASAVSDETARPATANAVPSGGPLARKNSSRNSTRSLRLQLGSGHHSNPSTASRSSSGIVNFSKTPLSPMALLSPSGSDKSDDGVKILEGESKTTKAFRRKSVDEMTMLLDQMIQDKVESGHVVRGERGSLRVKRDTVMEKSGVDAIAGAENGIKEEEIEDEEVAA